MNVFFDCEFSRLPQEGEPKLISIGCKADDGRRSFYAELSNWEPSDCSKFVTENVLPLLSGGDCRMTDVECARKLTSWVESLSDGEVIFISDNPAIDWPLVEKLFSCLGGWPNNLRRICGAINFIGFEHPTRQQIFDDALVRYWKPPLMARNRHHALFDAGSLVFAWWHAQAPVMANDEFEALMKNLSKNAMEDGDIGFNYWSGIQSDLRSLRIGIC